MGAGLVKVLAFDCSTARGSVAAVEDGAVIFAETFECPRGRGGAFFEVLDRAIRALGRPDRIGWQPTTVAIFLRQINQNRVGVGQYHALIIDNRNLTKSVEREEIRLLVRALRQIDKDQLGRQMQQGQHQLYTMSVAGTREVVEFDRLHGRLRWVVVLLNSVQHRWGAIFHPPPKQQNNQPTQSIISPGEINHHACKDGCSRSALTAKSTKLRIRAGALRPP